MSLDEITKEYLLVMQYADGGDLQNYLENNFKNLTWNDKKKLSYQIANGLNYCYHVISRDTADCASLDTDYTFCTDYTYWTFYLLYIFYS